MVVGGAERRHRQRRCARRTLPQSPSRIGQQQWHVSIHRFHKRLDVADQIVAKCRKVPGPPSGEPVAAVVARGEVEIGFQQVSELIHVPGIIFVGSIPAELQLVTTYAAVLTRAAQEPEAAGALIHFLTSPAAAPTISKAGLTPLPRR